MNDLSIAKITKIIGTFCLVNNLSRQKCLTSMVMSMIKTRSVQLPQLAKHLNYDVLDSSNERRLQDFFQNVDFDKDNWCLFLSLMLSFGKVHLSIDRTEWDFGNEQVNLLIVAGSCNGLCVPLYIEYLDNNSGNSNTEQRIDVLNKVLQHISIDRIASFTADREFIGEKWFNYLVNKNIPFFIRIPKSYIITLNGTELKVPMLLGNMQRKTIDNVTVLEVKHLRVAISITADKNGQPDFLIVISNTKSKNILDIYKKRWGIEAMFQDFKTQGFNLEQTHLRAERLVKLMYCVSLAYILSLCTGLYIERHIEPPIFKKHGYRAKSIIRKGIDLMQEIFNKKTNTFLILWHRLVDDFFYCFLNKLLYVNSL